MIIKNDAAMIIFLCVLFRLAILFSLLVTG